MIPTAAPSSYQAARERAALLNRADRARIVVSGGDRRSYLHGLLTNDITSLQSGQGCYAAYLTPQGRMIAELWVYELGDVMLIMLPRDVKDTVLAKFDQFIFTEDVQLGDVTDTFAQVGIVGPDAAQLVSTVVTGLGDELRKLPEHGNVRGAFEREPSIILRTSDAGEPGFDIIVPANQLSALTDALRAAGAVDLDEQSSEALRIEGGIPRFHRDMDEETIPLEAGIESRAISLTKGCYVGQEVIIRVLHRGHGRVAKKLVGILFEGDVVPASHTAAQAGDKDIGRVTSSVLSPALHRPIALAYVHRDFLAPGTRVLAGGIEGEVTALPFVVRG